MNKIQKWFVRTRTTAEVNGFGTFGGLNGAAFSIGWEMGRVIAKNPSYRKNIRPHLQDLFGFSRDEYLKEQKCIMCEYIEQQEKSK